MEEYRNIPTRYMNLANMVSEYLYEIARVTPLTRQQAVAGSNGLMQYLNTLDHRYLVDTILDHRGRPVNLRDIANNLGDTVIFAITNARPGIHAGVTANAVAEILREGYPHGFADGNGTDSDEDAYGKRKSKPKKHTRHRTRRNGLKHKGTKHKGTKHKGTKHKRRKHKGTKHKGTKHKRRKH